MKAQPATTKNQLRCQSGHIPWRKGRRFVIFCMLSFLVLLFLPLHANDETSVEVSSLDYSWRQISGVWEYTESFKAVTKEKALSYSWSTTKGEIIGSRTGNSIKIKVSGSNPFSLEAGKVTCYCTFNKKKSESGSRSFYYPKESPKVGITISGPSLIEWEDVDKGKHFSYKMESYCEFMGKSWEVSKVNWSIDSIGKLLNTSENGDEATVEFRDDGTCKITCTAEIGSCKDTVDFHIQVMPQFVNFTVRRANYEVDSENKHINFITGPGLRCIHWNIDDDNWSATEKPVDPLRPNVDELGCDCEELYFEKGFVDDDLCEIEIKPSDDINVRSGKLTISIPENFRLWSSQKRGEGTLLLDPTDSTTHTWNLKNGSDRKALGWDSNAGTVLYIEGLKMQEDNSSQDVTVFYNGLNVGKYSYSLCASGTKQQQPTKKERRTYTRWFPGLVGCEWHVKIENE